MEPLASYLRDRLRLKSSHVLVELEKFRTDNCASCFKKQMYEVRDGHGHVLGLYDTWLFEEGEEAVFGYFQYAPNGDLMGRRTFYLGRL